MGYRLPLPRLDHPVRNGVASRPSFTGGEWVTAFPSSHEEGCPRSGRGGVVFHLTPDNISRPATSRQQSEPRLK
jgi:hypothetical protein